MHPRSDKTLSNSGIAVISFDLESTLTWPKTSRLLVAQAQTHVNCFQGLGTIASNDVESCHQLL